MLLGAYGQPRLGGLSGACIQHQQPLSQRVAAPYRLQISAGIIGPGKKWEHYDKTKNGLPVRQRLHVKLGDVVQVITGSDKGKVGKVKEIDLKLAKVVVEGVNIRAKMDKRNARGSDDKAPKKSESPVAASNVMHYSEGQKVASRVGNRVENGKKVRYLKKTGEVIDKQ
ncbi:hypothetical protein WJX73_009461 [Symbiochloris irregularis]|uniref:KOW domain-containing protein n=1 Tax=Symbiochloris irregularis TaxID=706552 RepID=A0AAW1NSJ9_9CHLO